MTLLKLLSHRMKLLAKINLNCTSKIQAMTLQKQTGIDLNKKHFLTKVTKQFVPNEIILTESKMDEVFEKFDQLWKKSLLEPNDKTYAGNSQFFHKARLDSGLFQDMNDFLKEEFYHAKQNIFEFHLYLIDKSLKEKVN